jgi:peptide/nickel transport system substrate-binding protein
MTIDRNPDWYGGEAPIEQVSFRFIPDTNSLVAAQQAGEISFINPPPDIGLAEKLEGIDGSQTATDAGTIWEALHFNLEKIPNLQLRQAVAYGINREQVINEILAGQNVPTLQSVIVPDLEDFYVPAWEDYTYDPERARQLVQEAEAAGADPTIEFSTTSGNALRETLQQVIQQQLKDVGITVTIKNYSAEQFFGEITIGGDFEMGEWAWVQSPDPQITTLFAANSLPPEGQNYYRYKNAEVTRLLEESDRAIDQAERADLIKQAQEVMVEDMPIIPLFQRPQIYAFADNLSGPVVNSTLAGPFWNIGEWEVQ